MQNHGKTRKGAAEMSTLNGEGEPENQVLLLACTSMFRYCKGHWKPLLLVSELIFFSTNSISQGSYNIFSLVLMRGVPSTEGSKFFHMLLKSLE